MSAELVYISKGLLRIRARISLFPSGSEEIKGNKIQDLDKLIEGLGEHSETEDTEVQASKQDNSSRLPVMGHNHG